MDMIGHETVGPYLNTGLARLLRRLQSRCRFVTNVWKGPKRPVTYLGLAVEVWRLQVSPRLRLESRQEKPSSSQIALQLFYILEKSGVQSDRFRSNDVLL